MVTWHNKVAFDGAWIDMSEVVNSRTADCLISTNWYKGLLVLRGQLW